MDEEKETAILGRGREGRAGFFYCRKSQCKPVGNIKNAAFIEVIFNEKAFGFICGNYPFGELLLEQVWSALPTATAALPLLE